MIRSSPNSTLKWSFGHLVIILFILVHPFHYVAQTGFSYYREAFSVLFILAGLIEFGKSGISRIPLVPVAFMSAFVLALVAVWLLVLDRQLYNGSDETVLDDVALANPGLYVIRNATLYLPLTMLAGLLPWRLANLRILAQIIATASIASVVGYLIYKGVIFQPSEIVNVIRYGASGLSYNSYVPYLTFTYACAIFWASQEHRFGYRITPTAICVVLTLYAAASGSRQSTLFIGFTTVSWAFLSPRGSRPLSRILLCGYAAILVYILAAVGSTSIENERFATRFLTVESFTESTRASKAAEGANLLTASEYLHGAGLGSVIFGGPHNDYVRWAQRVGIPAMILGFVPYLWAMAVLTRAWLKGVRSVELTFLITACSFVLVHSMFGYPRDDAFQAPYVYLSLGLCIASQRYAAQRHLLLRKKQLAHIP